MGATVSRSFAVVRALGLLLPVLAGADAGAAARPNVVLLMADDMGWSDLGSYGGEIRTPSIDRLAAEGLRFTQFYNTAKCAPTRSALLTGLYHVEVGNQRLLNSMTIAEALREAGYLTLMTGKWHLDGTPLEHGFDRFFGHLQGQVGSYFGNAGDYRLDNERYDVPESGFHATDAVTDFALRFLDEAAGEEKRPFLLYVAFAAPHIPLEAPPEDIRPYRGRYGEGWDVLRRERYQRQIEMGLIRPEWRLPPRPGDIPRWDRLSEKVKAQKGHSMAVYAAMVDRLDRNVGRILAKLEEMGVADDTLVMFLSDNGASPFGRTPGWAHLSNTPFRLYKRNQHEGGISTPFVVRWPARIRHPGTITHQVGHVIDVMPTLLDVAGVRYPKSFAGRSLRPLRGTSLERVFRGKQRKDRDPRFFMFGDNRAVREGKWKLVSADGGPWELYDMEADRTELVDLAARHPERCAAMARAWEEWVTEARASRPGRKEAKGAAESGGGAPPSP